MGRVATPLLILVLLLSWLSTDLTTASSSAEGEITDISFESSYTQGELVKVYVDVRNPTSTQWHYLVAVEIHDPDGNVVYDSHPRGEDIDHYVSGYSSKTFGSYNYDLPDDAPTGTYHVLAGLRLYPWEPELDYRGESWCPPEETFGVEAGAGPPQITGVSPNTLVFDEDTQFTITGSNLRPSSGLPSVTLSTGAWVHDIQVNPAGTEITVSIFVTTGAQLGPATIYVATDAGDTTVGITIVEAGAGPPQITGVSPNTLVLDEDTQFTITGSNLKPSSGLPSVTLSTGAWVHDIQVNPAGTEITVSIFVTTGAQLGPATIYVATDAGDTTVGITIVEAGAGLRLGEIGGLHYLWWDFGIDNFESLRIYVTIYNEPDNGDGLYFQMYQGRINNVGFYFGLQTQLSNPNTGVTAKGLIFSRWETRDLSNVKPAEGGWSQSAGYEGDFVGIRKHFEWTSHSYQLKIAYIECDEVGDWYGVWICDLDNSAQEYLGSIRFPSIQPSERGIENGWVTWTELYSKEIQQTPIPNWHVSIDGVYAGEQMIPALSGTSAYSDIGHTDIHYEGATKRIHFLMGPAVVREHGPGTIWLSWALPPAPSASIYSMGWHEDNNQAYAKVRIRNDGDTDFVCYIGFSIKPSNYANWIDAPYANVGEIEAGELTLLKESNRISIPADARYPIAGWVTIRYLKPDNSVSDPLDERQESDAWSPNLVVTHEMDKAIVIETALVETDNMPLEDLFHNAVSMGVGKVVGDAVKEVCQITAGLVSFGFSFTLSLLTMGPAANPSPEVDMRLYDESEIAKMLNVEVGRGVYVVIDLWTGAMGGTVDLLVERDLGLLQKEPVSTLTLPGPDNGYFQNIGKSYVILVRDPIPLEEDGTYFVKVSFRGYYAGATVQVHGDYVRAEVHSPVELRVYDSLGKVTGIVGGELRKEIPYSDCYGNVVTILSPTGSYKYEVVGTGEGSYDLEVTFSSACEVVRLTATDILISPNATHQFTITPDVLSQGEKAITLQVDSDGDGAFEQVVHLAATEETKERPPNWLWVIVGVLGALLVVFLVRRTAPRKENAN